MDNLKILKIGGSSLIFIGYGILFFPIIRYMDGIFLIGLSIYTLGIILLLSYLQRYVFKLSKDTAVFILKAVKEQQTHTSITPITDNEVKQDGS